VVTTLIDDGMIIDCYRLAAHYHLDPRIFLEMPISEVQLHLDRTWQLERTRAAESGE
jgi:hypothetical protein